MLSSLASGDQGQGELRGFPELGVQKGLQPEQREQGDAVHSSPWFLRLPEASHWHFPGWILFPRDLAKKWLQMWGSECS